jgi:hypothetical protein
VQEVKSKLKSGLTAVKQRAHATKLKHEVKRLQTAVGQQNEAVGVLVLQHQPGDLDVSAETQQLSQVQEDLAQKQTTLASLENTSGSGTVVKQLKQEVAGLQEQQRSLMVGIGEQAFAARVDMPGVAGHYAGLEQLHQTLQAKESELETLAQQLGPIWERPTSFSLRNWIKPLAAAGGVILGLLVLWMAVTWLFAPSSGIPSWARYYVDGDTQMVAYVNMSALVDSEVYEDIAKLATADKLPGGLEVDDVREVFSVASDGDTLLLVRTYEDFPLDDFASEGAEIEEYRDVNYAKYPRQRFQRGYVAKLGSCLYGVTENVDLLKDAISRLDRQRESELSDELQEALRYAAREKHYIASRAGGRFGDDLPDGVNTFGAGASLGSSSLDARSLFMFRSERTAEDFVREYEEMLEEMEEGIGGSKFERMPEEMKRAVEDSLEMFRQMKVRRSGKHVTVRGSCDVEHIENMVHDLASTDWTDF